MKYNKVMKLIKIFAKASDEFDQEAQVEEMQEAEFLQEEMGQTSQIPEAPSNIPEDKKTSIQAMEESILSEANSTGTPLDRLVKITKMQRKFAVPAMITFIRVAEKKQEPLFNYAKDMLYGRIPKHEEEFSKYMDLKKHFEPMSQDDLLKDPYRIVDSMFTLWAKALNRAASRKFKGQKGSGRGKMYSSPISIKHKKKDPRISRPEESEPIFTSPIGEYTDKISR